MKIISSVLALITIVGAVTAVESRYALASDLDAKADKGQVIAFQRLYLEDRIDELEFNKFQITKKAVELRTDDEAYKLQKLTAKIEKMKRSL